MDDTPELKRALVWGRSQLPSGGYEQYGRLLAVEIDRLRRELAEAQRARDAVNLQEIDRCLASERREWEAKYQRQREDMERLRRELAEARSEQDTTLGLLHEAMRRLAEARELLTKAERWCDYYRAKWLGPLAVPQPPHPDDAMAETSTNPPQISSGLVHEVKP